MAARSDEDFLADLRKVLHLHGKLTTKSIRATTGVPSPNSYFDRFGSLGKAYEAVGYKPPRGYFGGSIRRRKTEGLKRSVIEQVTGVFKKHGCKVRALPHAIHVRGLGLLGIELAPQALTRTGKPCWVVNTGRRVRHRRMIVARISERHEVLEFVLLNSVPRTRCNFRLTPRRLLENPMGSAEQIIALVLEAAPGALVDPEGKRQ